MTEEKDLHLYCLVYQDNFCQTKTSGPDPSRRKGKLAAGGAVREPWRSHFPRLDQFNLEGSSRTWTSWAVTRSTGTLPLVIWGGVGLDEGTIYKGPEAKRGDAGWGGLRTLRRARRERSGEREAEPVGQGGQSKGTVGNEPQARVGSQAVRP